MAVDLQRLHVKFYLVDGSALSPEDAFRVFSEWIPQTTDEVLIDVADYTHVGSGPLTVLVGHDANYALDDTDGRLGLVYGRKSATNGPCRERLRDAFAAALKACRRLETHPELSDRVRFAGAETVLVVNDRLRAPNTEATLASLRADLDAFLGTLYAGAATRIERDEDVRHRFAVRIRAEGEFDVPALMTNLAA